MHSLEEGATSAARIADELLLLLSTYADQVGALSDEGNPAMAAAKTRQVTHGRRRSSGVGLALGWLRGDLAREVQRQIRIDQPIPLREKTELLGQALDRIRVDGLQPVVVFDRWIGDADAETVTGFFRDVIRWLTELPVSVVAASHARYFDLGVPRAELLEFLETPSRSRSCQGSTLWPGSSAVG